MEEFVIPGHVVDVVLVGSDARVARRLVLSFRVGFGRVNKWGGVVCWLFH